MTETPEETPLDAAFAAMTAAGDDATVRLQWYDRLAASELFLLLEEEAEGDRVRPRVFAVEDGAFICVFDREERLSRFAGGEAPYAAMSGRALAEMLAGRDLGLAVNLGVSSEMILDAAALDWLAGMLAARPAEVEEAPREIAPPAGLPEALLTALDARLASAAGLAREAALVAVVYAGGGRGHLLAFLDVVPGAEPSLARLVGEALSFSGLEAGSLDVGFFRTTEPVADRLLRVGLRFDLPEAEVADAPPGAAPGTDPDRPPRLR
ncbi:SseB family protein [Roseibacterium sp. SDUM158016]|uniref:SseB family protein n=1 Tax=Roseicyclus sediminis TaxID=2980997 RepID=UPI0021D0EA2D|nr:SseB family protein [Roseibacterium sp. SDUM158016]MCU4652925.1 SseB family protein [Roseibacterium sp. SDUM158016]